MTSKKYKDSYNSFISFYLVYQVFIGYHMRMNQSGPEHRTFHSKKQNSYPKGAAALKPALFQPLDHSSSLDKL